MERAADLDVSKQVSHDERICLLSSTPLNDSAHEGGGSFRCLSARQFRLLAHTAKGRPEIRKLCNQARGLKRCNNPLEDIILWRLSAEGIANQSYSRDS